MVCVWSRWAPRKKRRDQVFILCQSTPILPLLSSSHSCWTLAGRRVQLSCPSAAPQKTVDSTLCLNCDSTLTVNNPTAQGWILPLLELWNSRDVKTLFKIIPISYKDLDTRFPLMANQLFKCHFKSGLWILHLKNCAAFCCNSQRLYCLVKNSFFSPAQLNLWLIWAQ